jgi:hypothetical protein
MRHAPSRLPSGRRPAHRASGRQVRSPSTLCWPTSRVTACSTEPLPVRPSRGTSSCSPAGWVSRHSSSAVTSARALFQAPDFIPPSASQPSSAALLARLEAAAHVLDGALDAASDAKGVSVDHPVFGRLPLSDLVRFLMIHTNHHRPQLSRSSWRSWHRSNDGLRGPEAVLVIMARHGEPPVAPVSSPCPPSPIRYRVTTTSASARRTTPRLSPALPASCP